jgi:hypothetical protein
MVRKIRGLFSSSATSRNSRLHRSMLIVASGSSSSDWQQLARPARNADEFLILIRTDCLVFLSTGLWRGHVNRKAASPNSPTDAESTGSARGRPDPAPSSPRSPPAAPGPAGPAASLPRRVMFGQPREMHSGSRSATSIRCRPARAGHHLTAGRAGALGQQHP